MKAILAISFIASLTACNLPTTLSFKYVGFHECDKSRAIPAKPTGKAFCLYEEVKE